MNDPCPHCGNRHGGNEATCPALRSWQDEAIRDFQRAMDTDGGLTLPAWRAKWGRRVYNAVVEYPEIRERFTSEMIAAVCSSPW